MNELIERVAKAIDEASQPPGKPDYKILMENCARAAIEAMREPTPEMITAGNCRIYDEARAEDMAGENTEMTWRAMIDAALARR